MITWEAIAVDDVDAPGRVVEVLVAVIVVVLVVVVQSGQFPSTESPNVSQRKQAEQTDKR
jgi:hypothetical protein